MIFNSILFKKKEVSLAYEKVKETDVLDLSDGGQQLWETAKNK